MRVITGQLDDSQSYLAKIIIRINHKEAGQYLTLWTTDYQRINQILYTLNLLKSIKPNPTEGTRNLSNQWKSHNYQLAKRRHSHQCSVGL